MSKSVRLARLLLFSMIFQSGTGFAADFYVATTGNDHWSGTLAASNPQQSDGPFATLERARDEIRKLKGHGGLQGPTTVWVRGGTYALAQTFKLGAQDSGEAQDRIIYRAYENEKPVLTGGRAITGFVPYQGEILKADVGAQGLKGIYFRQLFFDDQRQILARYPNLDPHNPYGGGWAYADGKPFSMYKDVPGESKRLLHYKAADARSWSHPEEGEVFVYPRYDWWNNIEEIKSVDPAGRTITLAGDCSYAIRPNDRYYVQNLFEELDSPGEWYLDRRDWTLYFWPPAPLAGKVVAAPALRTLLELGPGTTHVTFRGFTFECCGGTAIVLTGTSDCIVAASVVRNAGDYHGSGISIQGGFRNGVVGNDISQIGASGISIDGGDRITLTPGDNYADNNYIHHVGLDYKQGVGIYLAGCGNRASHNLIHDGPRFGIQFAGNKMVVEYNHIRDVSLETSDTGAIYTGGRDWLGARGSVVRYNDLENIHGFGQSDDKGGVRYLAWGIYLDDNTGGVDVFGNIIARCASACLHVHNGRDNLVQNNVFVDGGDQQIQYDGWLATSKMWLTHYPTMMKGYDSVAGQPAWKQSGYINLSPSQSILPNGMTMLGNRVFCNVFSYLNPKAYLYSLVNVPFDHNSFDDNLIFHGGTPPVSVTGGKVPGKPSVLSHLDWPGVAGAGGRPTLPRGRSSFRRCGPRRLSTSHRFPRFRAGLQGDSRREDRSLRGRITRHLAHRRGAGRAGVS